MPNDESSLRARAGALLAERGGARPTKALGKAELRRLVHELNVHQIELELQNDELQATQRRLEESRAALAGSERRYRQLFEHAPVAYLLLDRNGVILETNWRLAELLAAVPDWLTGRKLSEFVVVSHQDAYFLHRQAALRGESPEPAQVTLRACDGELRDVELVARSVEGDVAALGVAIVDVSARLRAEAAHHESERQRRLLANALPIGVGYVAGHGRLEFCNRTFEELLGSMADALEGRFLVEVLGATVYAALREQVRTALAGEPARFEGPLSFAASGSRFVSVLLAPDWMPDGQVRGFWMLLDDRSEIQEARRSLRNAAAQIALAEQRERRALAADLHDDVGQLLALASIKLRALQAEVGQAAVAEPLGEVEELTRKARESVTSLTFELSPPLLYDVGFVATAEWLVENLKRRYGLRTTVEKRGEVPRLDETTRVTLFRALRELLINVAKHAGTSRAHILIEGGGDDVSVTVRDHGFGFDPSAPASGFGLRSITERIESLGGRVTVDAAPGKGATITLTVPADGRSSS